MSETQDRYREWDAAYVLGALSPDERREFERHLSECARCSTAVAELAGMPGILGLLSAADAADAGAADEAKDARRAGAQSAVTVQRLAAHVRAERRRTRRLVSAVAGAAAGLLFIGGIALGGSVFAPGDAIPAPSSSSTADVLAMTPLASGTLTAELTLTPRKWGTLLAWECEYEDPLWTDPDGGQSESPQYALYVTEADGTETAVATWRGAGTRAGGLSAATSIPAGDIRSVEIRTVPGNQPLAEVTL